MRRTAEGGQVQEFVIIDVYEDTAEILKDTSMPFGSIKEIIEDCIDDLQPFIDEGIPKEESEGGTDFSEDNYIEQISEFLAGN